jgi:AraC-like DNA-binding protein
MSELAAVDTTGRLAYEGTVLVELRLAAASALGDPGETRRRLRNLLRLLGASEDDDGPRGDFTGESVLGLAPWQAKRVRAFIDANLDQTLTVQQLADVARLSVSYFFRAFRGSFGTPPHAYIVQCRVERAQACLKSSNEPIAQVALLCGFCDQAHFSRAFARQTGVPPAAWRRMHRDMLLLSEAAS